MTNYDDDDGENHHFLISNHQKITKIKFLFTLKAANDKQYLIRY